MKVISHLILLIGGFLCGIYVGVHNPQLSSKIDEIRAQEQAKAKVAVLQKLQQVQGTTAANSVPAGGAGFVGSGGAPTATPATPTPLQQAINDEMAKAQAQLSK